MAFVDLGRIVAAHFAQPDGFALLTLCDKNVIAISSGRIDAGQTFCASYANQDGVEFDLL